jgi:hypothetical protein
MFTLTCAPEGWPSKAANGLAATLTSVTPVEITNMDISAQYIRRSIKSWYKKSRSQAANYKSCD